MKTTFHKINENYKVADVGFHSGLKGLEINSVFYPEAHKGGYVSEEPKSVVAVIGYTDIDHYENEDGKSLTNEEFQREKTRLEETQTDEDTWATLDDEFAWKKFMREWKPIRIELERREESEVVIYDISGRRDNPFITPLRFLGKTPVKDDTVLYEYTPSAMKMASEIADKLGLVWIDDKTYNQLPKQDGKTTWSVPNHSRGSLEFLKIGGEYAGVKSRQFDLRTITGSWEECETAYRKDYTAIKDVFDYQVAKLNATGPLLNAKFFVKELETIESLVKSIDAKRGSKTSTQYVANKVRTLISKIV